MKTIKASATAWKAGKTTAHSRESVLLKTLCTELTSLTQPPKKHTLTLGNVWGPSKKDIGSTALLSLLLRKKKSTAAPQWPSRSRLRWRSRSLSLLEAEGGQQTFYHQVAHSEKSIPLHKWCKKLWPLLLGKILHPTWRSIHYHKFMFWIVF